MNKFLLSISLFLFSSVTGSSIFAQELKGDIKAGQTKISMCIGCHGIVGYQASFPEIYKVPKIAGQGAAYIVSALTAYKKGERKHPTMRGQADNLSDQDMADIAAFYQVSGKIEGAKALGPAKPGSAIAQALVAKGACASCHGVSLSAPLLPAYPKIAGQHADYLYASLKSYKTEGNPLIGRSNAIMGGVVKQFSNAELKELANYLASLPGELQTVPDKHFR